MCIHKLHVEQVKGYLVGGEFIGEIPLYHKILAAFLTGENVSHFPACCQPALTFSNYCHHSHCFFSFHNKFFFFLNK